MSERIDVACDKYILYVRMICMHLQDSCGRRFDGAAEIHPELTPEKKALSCNSVTKNKHHN